MPLVLIIDDQPLVRKTISFILHDQGIKIVQAKSGRVGIQLARSKTPDLILCDIKMPKVDGFAVFDALQSEPSTSSIPFVFITGLFNDSSIQRNVGERGAAYMEKPFSVESLLAIVRANLSKPKG